MSRPSLEEYAGGASALLRLATEHHRLCVLDPQLNHPFSKDDVSPAHVERLAACWREVLGGPPADPEFRAALQAHVEWAVTEMVGHPEGDDDVPAEMAMPRWSWDGPVTAPAAPRPPT